MKNHWEEMEKEATRANQEKLPKPWEEMEREAREVEAEWEKEAKR